MKKKIIFIISVSVFISASAQEIPVDKKDLNAQKKAQKQSEFFTYQGNHLYQNKKPSKAEVNYRQAISKNKDNAVAPYNMGDLLYEQKSYGEAEYFFREASMNKNASKIQKHKAFHNMGNVYMQQKQYDKAVMAYKEALRNNSTDEETRYNLALAKEFLKNNPPQNNQNQDDKNNQQNQDNQQDKNNQEQNQDKQQNDSQNQDKQDNSQNNQNENNKPNQNQGDKQEQDKEDKGGENGKGNQPQKGQLSPQQAERILEAMNSEEKKTQEKINAQKVKGRPTRPEKDW